MIGYCFEPYRAVSQGGFKLCACGEARAARYTLTFLDHRWDRLFLCAECARDVKRFFEGDVHDPAAYNAKLTDAEVRAIRRAHHEDGETLAGLGERYDLHPTAIKKVLAGKSYRHVRDEVPA